MTQVFSFDIETNREESLPSPKELKRKLPATIAHTEFVEQSRSEIRQILNGTDPRLLLIVGPCSIHDPQAILEYASKLSRLAEEISPHFFTIMRVYFEKPRTVLGWKGFMYDPYLDGSHDVNSGVRLTRELFLTLTKLRIPLGAEFLDPYAYRYFCDLVSWGCIGARTSSSQVHRQIASGLSLPIAFKNNTDGNIEIAVNGALTASLPQTYLSLNEEGAPCSISSSGNSDSHVVLRGGACRPNYDLSSVNLTTELLRKANLPTRIIVDCSHDNSRRDHQRQPYIFRAVLDQLVNGNSAIRGLILESFLSEGNQAIPKDLSLLKYGVSITDPCLDWKSTEILAKEACLVLKKDVKTCSENLLEAEQVCSI